ncbi:MAG: hypothetical protein V7637_4356 [Mycobacteriales bacterium]
MLILIAWLAAAGFAVLVAGVVGYELAGHIRRLRKAVQAAVDDVLPRAQALVPPASKGRHRAPAPE